MYAEHLTPILNVSNLQESFAWFERLGWKKGWDWGDPPDFGGVCSSECEIFLCENGQGGRGKSDNEMTFGLGFEITFQGPDPDDIFFGMVCRGRAQILLKDVGVDSVPNHTRDIEQGIARWDAFVSTPDPDALAAEFASRHVAFSEPLKDSDDGLRGFEVTDPDSYVLFFGRPR